MSLLKDVGEKVRSYSFGEVFQYTGVSKVHIIKQLVALLWHTAIGTRRVEAPVNSYRMELDLGTPGLSKVLFIYGTRELMDTRAVKRMVTPEMNVLDLGANIGYYALLEASLLTTGHVYAFEPDPRNLPLLKRNIELNDFQDRISLYPFAVAEASGTREFHLGERSNVSSFVDREDVVDSVEVQCIRLDEFEHIDSINLIRMDVEGYECKVIEGMKETIKRTTHPLSFMIEVHADAYNEDDLNFSRTLTFLFDQGFEVEALIAPTRFSDTFSKFGYTPLDSAVETKYSYSQYAKIEKEHVLDFLDKKVIRSLLISRR